MDRLTHMSITNCTKELDALEKLVVSEEYTHAQIADWIAEISWNMAKVFRRVRYDSDEFQCLLKKLVQENKRKRQAAAAAKKEEQSDDI